MRADKERQKVMALAAEDYATVRERMVLLQETVRFSELDFFKLYSKYISKVKIILLDCRFREDLRKNTS